MTYCLGVDLGTTFTAAAVCRRDERPQMLSLGSSGYGIPSVLVLKDDGTFLSGEAAEMRAVSDPTRVARYFKRQLGDSSQRFIGGTPFSPQTLTSHLLRSVLTTATSRQGGPPERVVLTHPANWGPYRREVFEQAASMAGVTNLALRTEPEAAAINYATGERVEPGELIGVYDLGGGTFDAVIMRRTENGFEVVGQPRGVERLGGLDFDDVIWEFATSACEIDVNEIATSDDEAVIAAGHQLRANCTAAKRLLSADTSADIRVVLPGVNRTVRLTREEFEQRIRPRLAETMTAFNDALVSGKVQAEDLSRILLVGGSSRVPIVSQVLAQTFGRPLAVDTDPKNTVALGAAYVGTLPDAEHPPLPSEQKQPDIDIRDLTDLAPGQPPPSLSPPVDIREPAPGGLPDAPTPLSPRRDKIAAPARPASPETNVATSATLPTPPARPSSQPAPTPPSDEPVALPSLDAANHAVKPDQQPEEANTTGSIGEPLSELAGVQSESIHRPLLPSGATNAVENPWAQHDPSPVGVQAVADRRLPIVGAAVVLLIIVIVAVIVLSS